MAVSLSAVLPALSTVLAGSAGNESTCSLGDTGDEGSIPRLGQGPLGAGDGSPLHYSRLRNPTDGGAWWAAAHRVTESDRTAHSSVPGHTRE